MRRGCTACVVVALALQLVVRPGSGQTQEQDPVALGPLGVAIAMRHAGKPAEAESMLRAHLKRFGRDPAWMEELGLALAQQGKRAEAIAEYKLALKQFPSGPNTAALWSNLGLAYEFSKKEDEAEAAYKKAIAAGPQMLAAHVNLGNFYRFVRRDYKKAAVQLKKSLSLAPGDFTTHFGLAAIYADTGKLKLAIKTFESALGIQPGSIVAKTELAYVLTRTKKSDNLDRAEKLFESVISEHPSFYRAHEGLARLYQTQGRVKKAEAQAKRAVRLQSDEGTREVLADVYQSEGDMPHAHKWWRAVLKANPNDAAAKHYLALDKKGGDAGAGVGSDVKPPALEHSDFMMILLLSLGGGAVVVLVVIYSAHLKTKLREAEAANRRRLNDPEEGMGLMSSPGW